MWNYKFPYVSHFIWPSALVLGIYMIPGHKPSYETISEARERFRTIYRECHADIGTYKYRSSCEHMYEMSEAEFLKMAIKSWREAHPFY